MNAAYISQPADWHIFSSEAITYPSFEISDVHQCSPKIPVLGVLVLTILGP